MKKQHFYEAIGPVVNPYDFSIWHTEPSGKMCQLGIHVCRIGGVPTVDYICRTLHMSTRRCDLIEQGDEEAVKIFDNTCIKALDEIYETTIKAYGSLDNINLVATNEGFTGDLH